MRARIILVLIALALGACLLLGSFWDFQRKKSKLAVKPPPGSTGIAPAFDERLGTGGDAKSLPGSALGRPAPLRSGFGDSAWTRLPLPDDPRGNQNQYAADQITLHGAAYGHPHLLQGLGQNFDIDFDLRWDKDDQAAIIVGLFDPPEAAELPPLMVSFSKWGKRIWVAASLAGTNRMLDGDDYRSPSLQVSVRIERRDDWLGVYVNGEQLVDVSQTSVGFEGEGLRFAFGGPWFNSDTELLPTTISGLQVRRMPPGSSPGPSGN